MDSVTEPSSPSDEPPVAAAEPAVEPSAEAEAAEAEPTAEAAEPAPEVPAEPEPMSAELEAMLLGAVDDARSAIAEFSGADTVGEYLGAEVEDPSSATHRFLAELPGYRGWQWAVVVAACPG